MLGDLKPASELRFHGHCPNHLANRSVFIASQSRWPFRNDSPKDIQRLAVVTLNRLVPHGPNFKIPQAPLYMMNKIKNETVQIENEFHEVESSVGRNIKQSEKTQAPN